MGKKQEADLAVVKTLEEFNVASAPFVGQWRTLISTTNWEKGRIICQWRDALLRADALVTEYSDEAWAQRVGGVTGQHAGRLRRVYERFGNVSTEYEGLYWSHFQVALDWEDAEMWLEGAVQNQWSISQMRNARWEAIGGTADQRPREEDIYVGELDEDAHALIDPSITTEVRGFDSPSSHRELAPEDDGLDVLDSAAVEDDAARANHQSEISNHKFPIRPFENLADLPADLAEAFEQYKLAILHHKLAGWQEISRADVLASLDALKQLATAPSEG
ncbi:MAG: hypothetical protein WD851_24260 [Pirellulales bacterium]